MFHSNFFGQHSRNDDIMTSLALLLGVATPVLALPTGGLQSWAAKLQVQTQTWLSPHLPVVTQPLQKLVLATEDVSPLLIRQEIEEKQLGFLYGPSLLGNSSFFPAGVLGDAMIKQHQDQWYTDAGWLTKTVNDEAEAAMAAI